LRFLKEEHDSLTDYTDLLTNKSFSKSLISQIEELLNSIINDMNYVKVCLNLEPININRLSLDVIKKLKSQKSKLKEEISKKISTDTFENCVNILKTKCDYEIEIFVNKRIGKLIKESPEKYKEMMNNFKDNRDKRKEYLLINHAFKAK